MTTPPTSVPVVVLALLRELHWRRQRFDEIADDLPLIRRAGLAGETTGLWIALGVTLGHEAGPLIYPDAVDLYHRWVAAGMPDEVLP
ncbi:hypothetical protein [Streptomyces scabiei]|uniref:hypothetical protein n=1 Tax=Streptomyces scabiei TaxID=1930 RepID=UPI0029B7139D|nr:hypothetical protein [Streptomyces scabiei]MDX3124941.1 hypothetical protein [Streptomyces scabiei]MDX3204432.1 hypothetical protein [Streptomyces scabiei]MDX3223100.1 hypothetical protein [Streptomyces scabiei]